ncbi:MAG: ATP-dependent DNA helicase RecG [Bifidobacterium sp.]|uniref:ATP-dependent DNA helicase RecG n=1 Tax=Bifidobacterium sp. TaxID=41200 RepID=UPI003F09AACE
MTVSLTTPLAKLLTNRRRVSALKGLGMVTCADTLTYYPFRVTDPVPLRAVREGRIGEPMAFAGVVRDVRVMQMNARRGYRVQAMVDDSAFAAQRHVPGSVTALVFFSYKQQYVNWLSARLHAGASVVVCGTPSEYDGMPQFTHPEVLTVPPTPAASQESARGLRFDADSIDDALRRVCRPRPVYHANSRISSEHIHDSIVTVLRALAAGDDDNAEPSAAQSGKAAQSVETVQSVQSGTTSTTGPGTSPQSAELQESAPSPSRASSLSPSPDGIESSPKIPTAALRRAIPDILPESVREACGLMHRAEAFLAIHEPDSVDSFRQALHTLRYEEAFISQTAVLQEREQARKAETFPCADGGMRETFIDSLPFTLTGGQTSVIDDIVQDMGRDYPMQRLLQGEVGSGKTVVALAAMLQAVGSGYQAVLVAPTQVLAEQHAETIGGMVSKAGLDIPVTLVTGGMKLAARRKALAEAASGEPGIIIATHAAFSRTFQAPNLALAVIDEQHRFGVEQRETLLQRGEKIPHLLVMTATPIPRTAAMTWFGSLDLSWLTELPGGRKPIRTFVIPEADGPTMANMFRHIRCRIDAGERAYIVCARIDEDESDDQAGQDAELFEEPDDASGSGDVTGGSSSAQPKPPLHAVSEIAARLEALPQFQGVRFATLTGRDDDSTKQQVMADFAAGVTPVLVATTVIEVGVDVPQASCIVIFDADRFGLSQLHQLRGRVGRGGTDSWAFLVSRAEPGSIAEQRLAVIQGSLDGAEIAQADLELRGAGDVLGDAQSGGKSGLKLLRVVKDAKMIADARTRAEQVLADDPDLDHEVQLAGAVLDFTRGNESHLISS